MHFFLAPLREVPYEILLITFEQVNFFRSTATFIHEL